MNAFFFYLMYLDIGNDVRKEYILEFKRLINKSECI